MFRLSIACSLLAISLGDVSQAERLAAQKVLENLTPDDRAWLKEQLDAYRELLTYLHDH